MPLEEERKQEMFVRADFIEDAINYSVKHLSYIFYDQHGTINNCTLYSAFDYFVDRIGAYYR